MSGRLNFNAVTISPDGSEFLLAGSSPPEYFQEIQQICITYGKAPDLTQPMVVGRDLLPRDRQTEQIETGPFGESWTITIPITAEFADGGAIVIAASALRHTPGPNGGVAVTTEVWVGYIATGRTDDQPKGIPSGLAVPDVLGGATP